METFIERFPHIAEKVFEQLDDKTLTKCKEVSQIWKQFIDDRNLPWVRIVQIPTVLTFGKTYLHLAAETGQTATFKTIFQNEDEKNPSDIKGITPLHIASNYGLIEIVELLIQSSVRFKIDLNTKGGLFDQTAFHMACMKNQTKTAELLIQKSSSFNIDLNSVDSNGRTAF